MKNRRAYFVFTLCMASVWPFALTAGVAEFLVAELGDMKSAILASGDVAFNADSLLEAARAHEDDLVRSVAIEGLGLLQEQRACPLLRELLKEGQDRFIRRNAALGLAMLGQEDGFMALEKFMNDLGSANDPVSLSDRVYLAGRLAELGKPSGFKYVWEALDQKEERLKVIAMWELTNFLPLQDEIGETEIPLTRKIIELADDPSSEVRLNALSILSLVVGEGYSKAEDVLPVFERKAEKDDNAEVRDRARRLVISWKEKEARRQRDEEPHEEPNP